MMDGSVTFPPSKNISNLFSIILSCFLILGIIHLPPIGYDTTFLGLHFKVHFEFSQLAAFFCCLIVLLGSYSLMQMNSQSNITKSWQHSWLTALTAFAIAELLLFFPAYQMNWWITFFLGNFILFITVISEYATLSTEEHHQRSWMELWLTIVGSIALLMLTAYWHSNIDRLFFLLPLLGISFAGYSHRLISLQGDHESCLSCTLSAALASLYICIALFYWQISSTAFSLMSVSFLYVFISLISSIKDGVFVRRSTINALGILCLFWLAALWMF